MNALKARSDAIVSRLRVLPGAAERLTALSERARRLPPPRDDERIDANLVRGCVSRVWLVGEIADGHVQFRADADSQIVKGLVMLIWEIASGLPVAELVGAPDEPMALTALQLDRQLSPTRLHGMGQVWRRVRELAQPAVTSFQGRVDDPASSGS